MPAGTPCSALRRAGELCSGEAEGRGAHLDRGHYLLLPRLSICKPGRTLTGAWRAGVRRAGVRGPSATSIPPAPATPPSASRSCRSAAAERSGCGRIRGHRVSRINLEAAVPGGRSNASQPSRPAPPWSRGPPAQPGPQTSPQETCAKEQLNAGGAVVGLKAKIMDVECPNPRPAPPVCAWLRQG